jgi:hypothetical protein
MSTGLGYRLLASFEQTFQGLVYRHRASTQGDFIAVHLYEDLYNLNRSVKLKERIEAKDWVVNIQNTRQGIAARRDATRIWREYGRRFQGGDRQDGSPTTQGRIPSLGLDDQGPSPQGDRRPMALSDRARSPELHVRSR